MTQCWWPLGGVTWRSLGIRYGHWAGLARGRRGQAVFFTVAAYAAAAAAAAATSPMKWGWSSRSFKLQHSYNKHTLHHTPYSLSLPHIHTLTHKYVILNLTRDLISTNDCIIWNIETQSIPFYVLRRFISFYIIEYISSTLINKIWTNDVLFWY